MAIPKEYSFTRYLLSKKSVDDRALNCWVWERMLQALPPASSKKPLRVLEIGAGIGTMLERSIEWGLLTYADYTGIDILATNISQARQRFPSWAEDKGLTVARLPHGGFRIDRESLHLDVAFEAIDFLRLVYEERYQGSCDLIIAHALLDLVDVPSLLPDLFTFLADDGLFYFTLNFDGATILEPVIEPEFDALIEQLYHQTMDERTIEGVRSGDSRTGRRLFQQVESSGGEIITAGSSDWVVFPGPNGYPEDEAYFLHHIIHTIFQALESHPGLDQEKFAQWVNNRHTQIERAELVYIAHQLDFLGRRRSKQFRVK